MLTVPGLPRTLSTSCLSGAIVLALLALPSAAQAQSSRNLMSRVRQMQQQQQQQAVQMLQQQVSEAQKYLSQAESDLATAAGEVQSNKSQLQAARDRVDANEKEMQAATKHLHEVEAQILAAQSPESEYGKAEKQLEEAQLKLDEVVHQVLPALPAHEGPTTEQERSAERTRLTLDQKAKLKASPAYQTAMNDVSAANDYVNKVRKAVFEADPKWKEAHDARLALSADAKNLESNAKSAGAAYSASQKKFNQLNEQVMSARQVVTEGTQNLAALGAKPAAPPAKK